MVNIMNGKSRRRSWQKDGVLNITKVWVQVQVKNLKNILKKRNLLHLNTEVIGCDNAIDKVFNKKRADDRKEWLGDYDSELYFDTNKPEVGYNEFIDREMIHFSKYDNDRSIPNIMDGLKIEFAKNLVFSI